MANCRGRLLALLMVASSASFGATATEALAFPLPHGASRPVFSPDGKQIAFRAPAGLCILDLESRKTRTLLPPGQVDSGLTFAPDGESLYFLRRDPAQPEINELHRYWISSGKTKKLLSRVASAVAFSPDGESMVFLHQVKPGFLEVWVASPDGGGGRKLMAANYLSTDTWFPDADRVATDGAGRILLTASPRTGETKSVSTGINCLSMIWPTAKSGMFAIQTQAIHLGLQYGQIWHREADNNWNQITKDASGFSELVGITSDGATLAAIRPVFSSGFLEGLVGAFASMFPTQSPLNQVKGKHIDRYDLVLLRLGR
jgi:hypothetical protein